MVLQDGPDSLSNVKLALDNLTQDSTPATRRLPPFIAISVANGGGDSKGSERGLEYDTMSDRFARFVDTEVLPAVLANSAIKAAYPNLKLTTDPDGRGSVGCSSGGAAALTMGWFRPDLFHRIVTYSGTFVDQQDDDAPEEKMYPLGAWEYHSGTSLIANSPVKPLRIFVNANDMDNGATAAESGHHNWLLANQRTAAALKAKNYHYRFVLGQGATHCDGKVRDATLADTLVWVWRGYQAN
jgi:enterochelin esterase family protein